MFVRNSLAYTYMYLCYCSVDSDTSKYGNLLPQMLEILNTVCETNPHVNSQECIVVSLYSTTVTFVIFKGVFNLTLTWLFIVVNHPEFV